MNYRQYIVCDPVMCGDEPGVKGTRVTVRTVLASLAEGTSIAEVVKDFPTLGEEAARAVIAFAAAFAEEDLHLPPGALACIKIKLHLRVRSPMDQAAFDCAQCSANMLSTLPA